MIGKVLGDRYEIIEEVGVGGMAKVYKALDTVLNRYVAVKVLKNEYMEDQDFLRKFAMEAQSAASLTHANIVSVFDVGSSYVDGRKYNYIVMEYVDGKTLKDIIDEKQILPIEDIVNYGVQIASALECAHKNGIIHRDIKPHNMLIDKSNNLKATDFGIARISSSATLTYTSTVLGTVHYISPEQAKGKFIDEKSDIYSLGVVLYQMATGEVPFDAPNAVGIALKHIQDPLVPPINLRHDLPQGLNDIIVKAMAKDPNDRFKSATELKEMLRNYQNYSSDLYQKTTKNPIIKENDEQPEVKEAVYKTPKQSSTKDNKNKSKKFMWILLPIVLAALVFIAIIFGKKYINKNKQDLVLVPALTGLTETEALNKAKANNLIAVVSEYKTESNVEPGKVLEQDPESSTEVKKGTIIKLVVSKGEEQVSVPNLSNMTIENAKIQLNKLGLEIGEITKENSDNFEAGKIMQQHPDSGTSINKDSKVDVVISLGKKEELVEMVDLIGADISQASNKLKSIGLNIGNIEKKFSNSYDTNQVIWQQYDAGKKLKKDSSIDVIISKGKKEPEMIDKIFRISKPVEKGIYTVTIKDETENNIIYEENHNASEGDIRIKVKVKPNNDIKVYINGELVNVG
ncbi:Stk1 family PASTA domain-containing Ser/Thr kinase [Finegoldia sp. BIOML-A2]|uniref:Stk1 family PASTA domain-containing Ser/Thr kinase n=1 Tax=Finegoldia TaxID=150022 RepID=UPI000B91744E|nr:MULTISPECIES: Stk1 family PASTA domain-containing Ser/Thr kinase [Finegoldia]MCC2716562.1 Stk1 family PASTA domain-containing Ser/Thr kinase [Finegoldia magna]MDU2499805.1 Stk1 family PASTA domain-containing Ser/Thr kinase [Finegoldia magna]MDU3805193.1 Stk1 family PASTA domain-containing Ser/Thr kinase [Finegoldia magna]MSA97194.1 Stk1 family PASTA domain-containing Ser/Thr kinase [Finegoldia sp. BIOML-A5]MSB00466.1 Stk1 family PASTA domain-containing Ser/Thr kinase [Finegoldia sp. BIOML-A